MQLTTKEKLRLRTNYGDWAVITGASSGIGLELATQLAAAGFNLVLNARNLFKLEKAAASIQVHNAVEIHLVAADVAESAGRDELLGACQTLPIGLFIASAGFGTSGHFIQNSIFEEMKMLELNCTALMVLTHHFANRFVTQRWGGIVLLSSIVAFQGTPSAANYVASKAYVQTLGEGLAEELRDYSIDVLVAAPGPVASGFGARANMIMRQTMRPE